MGEQATAQLTPETLAVIEEFKSFMEREGLPYGEAAAKLHCSASRLHQTLKLSYSGDVHALCRRMAEVLAESEHETKPAAAGFVETAVACDVIAALHLIHSGSKIGVVLGAPGIGKSAAAQFYAESKGREVVYELVGPGGTPHSLLRSLAGRLGVSLVTRDTQYAIRQAIVEKVRFGDYLLILDDADLMVEQSLQTLRCIHDQAPLGIAFIGTLAFLERLRQRQKATMEQFLSRVGFQCCLGALSDADITRLVEPHRLGEQALKSLIRYAGGSARRATFLLDAAVRIGGERPGVKAIQEALKTLLPVV